jgi:hypothetical protein
MTPSEGLKGLTPSMRSKTTTRMFTAPLLFSITLHILVRTVRREKQREGIQIVAEEIKLSLFAGGIILCTENTTEPTKKLLE